MNGNNDEEIEFSEPLPTAEQMDAILAGLIKHLDFFSKKYPARTEEKAKASQQLVKKWAQNIAAIASADSTASIQAEQRAESAKYNLALFSLATLIDGSQVYGGIQSESWLLLSY